MDGIIAPIEARLKRIEEHLFGPAMSAVAADAQKNIDDNPPDPVDVVPAQTLHASRMPAVPGMPIGNYDPTVAQDDDTDAAMNAEAEWKANPKPAFIPREPLDPENPDPSLEADDETRARWAKQDADDGDPTLNADGTPIQRRNPDGTFA